MPQPVMEHVKSELLLLESLEWVFIFYSIRWYICTEYRSMFINEIEK